MSELNIKDTAIVLIAGHGGNDSGATWADGTFEKKHTLEITKKEYNLMKDYIKLYALRTKDETIELEERAEFLNKLSKQYKYVDVYSNHFNAFNTSAKGSEICLSLNNMKDSSWAGNFLSSYCKKFGFNNRGVLRRKSTKTGLDYYYMMRKTKSNVRFKYIEYGFGDNSADMKLIYDNFDKIAEFTAESILSRYGFSLYKKEEEIKYIVQAGAFNSLDNAQQLQKKLLVKGFNSIIKNV